MFATEVQVILNDVDRRALLEQIEQQFAGAGLRYWVTPLIDAAVVA